MLMQKMPGTGALAPEALPSLHKLTKRRGTTVDSRYLMLVGAKIRELSGSPIISAFPQKPNSRVAGSQSHSVTSAPLKPRQYGER